MLFEMMNKGGFVMYPLLLCSMISLAVILERLYFWITATRDRDQDLINRVLELAAAGEFKDATELAGTSDDYIAKILLC
ncbi:MotA/TolQ/ExbB proton channel family protein, partial [Planctomycetota bacterium]